MRAVQIVRQRAKRVAMLGFSAGGHLTASVSGSAWAPDLCLLVYPVIVMLGKRAHVGCVQNLLGPKPSTELKGSVSAQRGVDGRHPPTFLVHTLDDATVPHEHSVIYAGALRKGGVPHELHLFERGKHGFGLGLDDPALGAWRGLCETWLKRHWSNDS